MPATNTDLRLIAWEASRAVSDAIITPQCMLRSLAICLFALFLSSSAVALERDRTIFQLAHRTWSSKEGAPGQITSLAQTTDGYLWIGTTHGLFRFDGVRFEAFQPSSGEALQSSDIYSLLAVSDGGLWVGFHYGGVSFLKNGRATNYGEREGLPPGRVARLAIDHEGTIWAAANSGLARLVGRRWEVVGAERGFTSNSITSIFVDSRGTLWVATGSTVLFLPAGEKRFLATGEQVTQIPQFIEASDGTVWMSDVVGNWIRPIRPNGVESGSNDLKLRLGSLGFLFDRDGGFWATTGEGIRRLPHPELFRGKTINKSGPPFEIFATAQGLTAEFAWPIIEDREGTIWIGTSKGLDQFRDIPILPVPFSADYLQFGITADSNGAIWTGNLGRKMTRIHSGTGQVETLDLFSSSGYRDSKGVLRFQDKNGVWSLQNGKQIKIPWPKEVPVPQHYPMPMTSGPNGEIWFSIEGHGIFSLQGTTWTRLAIPQENLKLAPLSGFTDLNGHIWFGYGGGTLILIDGESVRTFSPQDGINVGSIKAITGNGRILWIGGDQGLAFYDGARFRSVAPAGDEAFTGISGIVEADDGSLWLSENRGIVHIPQSEAGHTVEDPDYRIHYEVFDSWDGLPGIIQQARPFPTVIKGSDGCLWFATTGGAAEIDPRHMYKNMVPPLVTIESVLADGKRYEPFEAIRFPLHTANLEINYTALSLAVPEHVRFQYMLEGAEENWREAGPRRQAFYTRLAPGQYRFRVRACNNDGVWNEGPASIQFFIPPAFYQTIWFRALVALSLAGLIWVLYLMRLRRIARIYKERMEERLEERERIARELHDTLLQGVQGLILKFDSVSKQIPGDEPARQKIEKILDQADQVLTEGRDRVRKLRSTSVSLSDLPTAFQLVADEKFSDRATSFKTIVEGRVRELHPMVLEESYSIGREALINAITHSECLHIEVEIIYNPRQFRLRVRDDGRGIDSSILENGGRADHWGLPGMRERAQRIGGQLELWSRPGAGTEIELIVPGATAYRVHRAKAKSSWLGRFSRNYW